jgi:hypothetical protein
MTLRQLEGEEVEDYVRFLNDPRRCLGQDFFFVSSNQFQAEFARTSFLTADSAVLGIDLPDEKHVGVASWYVANSSLGNLELRVDFYRAELDTVERRQEAYRLLCAYLFETKPVARLQVLLRPEDEVGLAAATSLGFRYEGILKSLYFHDGAWRDLRVLSVLRDELHD